MSGKSYTMREMKGIVDYLTEHRAYAEVKGRKMWMDYANSNLTSRTWQSLKETFIKRIMPDITNPYYKLTIEQIASFRQGSDLGDPLHNKLEIQTINDDSSNDNASSSSTNTNGKNNGGEDTRGSKIEMCRSSVETVVIEPCYNTAEEIQKDLETSSNEKKKSPSPIPCSTKSIRDYITYSEPLTPMLQEVLHDFASDDEGDEPQMQIVEYPEHIKRNETSSPIELLDTENNDVGKKHNEEVDNTNIIKSNNEESVRNNVNENVEHESEKSDDVQYIDDSEEVTENTAHKESVVSDTNEIAKNCNTIDNVESTKSQNSSNSTINTLPNNQEAFKELHKVTKNTSVTQDLKNSSLNEYNNDSRKRAKSLEIDMMSPTKKLCIDKTTEQKSSDIDKTSQLKRTTESKKSRIQKKNHAILENENKSKSKVNSHDNSEQAKTENISKSPAKSHLKSEHEKKSKTQVKSRANSENNIKTKTHVKRHAILEDNNKTNVKSRTNSDNETKSHTKVKNSANSENDITTKTRVKSHAIAENENKSKTLVKRCADSDTDKNKNYNPVNLDIADDVISEIQESCSNSTKNGETFYISDDSSYKKQQISENVPKKISEDEASMSSEVEESFKNYRTSNRSRKQCKNIDYNRKVIKDISKSTPKKNKGARYAMQNIQRDRALANVFGSYSGARSSRKKNVKRLSTSQQYINTSSSDEWTSDTGPEYISPPRGRKNRHAKKYLKPKSARILSLEEEGGLFVMYGKRIYPVVKDGNLVKNYVTYSPDRDTEAEEESFWKLKYVEEKKKTEELKKLLKDNKKCEIPPAEATDLSAVPVEAKISPAVSVEAKDPVALSVVAKDPQVVPAESQVLQENKREPTPSVAAPPKENIEKSVQQTVKEPEKKREDTGANTLKIQFVKNNETVQLEGQWEHIHPVLEQVRYILNKPEPKEKPAPKRKSVERSPPRERRVSGYTSPMSTVHLDDDVQEKLDKLEEQIYKEIQERDIAESSKQDDLNSNVTKRNVGRPRLRSSTTYKADTSSEPPKKKQMVRAANQDTNDTNIVTRQQTGTPRKSNDRVTGEKGINVRKRSSTRTSKQVALDDDSEIRYKFPSQHQEHKNKSTKKMTPKQTSKRTYKESARGTIFSSPDNITLNSIESTQGYQDSDASHLSISLRKKRKLNVNVLNRGRGKRQRVNKRKPKIYIHEDSDSNISFFTAPLKSSSQQSSSLNSEVYRSDSYQLLFPQRQNPIRRLEKIQEKSPANDDENCLDKNYGTLDVITEKSTLSVNEKGSPFGSFEENSSNVTLPPSPAISIVENLSLNKIDLGDIKNINVPEDIREDMKQSTLNEYMILDIDMSVPLMQQQCRLQKSGLNENECNFNINVPEISEQISNSLVNKVRAVNIAEPALSESIHEKLKNLLLESAKKIANQLNRNDDTAKENKMEICEPDTVRKTKARAKKRCSTPCKRQCTQNFKVGNFETNVEKEHIEFYGYENPCPPPTLIVTDIFGTDNIATDDVSAVRRSDRVKKKKDVIKVKILKPKVKKNRCSSDSTLQKESKTSLQRHSGINDTESGVFLRDLEDSVDLIHNHSDTCLQANECIDASVQIVDDNAVSLISLNSNSINNLKCASPTNLIEDKLSDIYCENAQDAANLYTVTETLNNISNKSSIFKSASSFISPETSLLTNDLSEEIASEDNMIQSRISKWYLLSEDEASNTNIIDMVTKMSNNNTRGCANLNDIFPVTCAVPDLSTITEENTAKTWGTTIDGNTKSEFDTQSMPND